MKKIISLVLALFIGKFSFCQETVPSPTLTKQDYLKKSKSQKTASKIIAGTGAALAFTGLLLVVDDVGGIFDPNDQENTKAADALTYTGLVIMAGSIPFFIASSKNRKKAMSMSFKNQRILQLQNAGFVYRAIPSVNLKISL
jgi:hypothetical protein